MRRTLTVTAAIIAASLIPAVALAQAAGTTAEPAAVPEAPPADKPLAGKGAFSLERFEDALFDEKAKAIQKRMSSIRQKKISSLEDLVSSKRPYKNKADVLFRLAEAKWEEAKYQYLLDRDRYDKAYTCFEEKRCAEEPVEPRENYDESLQRYREILGQYPSYGRMDEVLYYFGRSAVKAGKAKKDVQLQKEGVRALNDLVQKYARSPKVAQTHLLLGEHYFENDSLFYAKTNYEKIIENHPRSAMFNYALYKLGWVYFNLAEFEKTVKTFQRVVSAIGSGSDTARVEFRSQALNDLVVTWAEMDDGWKDARRYFLEQVGEEDTYVKLDKMAGLLVSKDKDLEAIDLYKHLIEHEKVGDKNVEYYDAVMEVRRRIGDIREIESEINEIVNFFDHRGAWFTTNQSNTELSKAADELVSTNVFYLANHFHRRAQALDDKRKPSKPEYTQAAHYYSMFLERFPDHADSYKLNFYYAEILYEQIGEYEKAAEQYEKVIDKDKRGTFLEDAALGVIYSIERMLVDKGLKEEGSVNIDYVAEQKEANTDLKKDDLKPVERTDLDTLETRYVKAADTYVDLLREALKDPEFTKSKENKGRGTMIPNIMFIAAQTFYKHGQYREAIDRLMVIFELYPEHKMASIAVNTIIDAYARLKYWDKIEGWARKLIAAKNFKVKTKAELEQMIAIAKTEHARDLTKQRKFDEAIRVQQEIVTEFGRKNKKLASAALYNIGVIHESARRFPEAVAAYEQVIKKYPKEDVAVKAQFDIGVLYENQTKFEEAAAAFIEMKRFKTHKRASDAIRNAGLLYEALERYDEAHDTFQLYIRTFPKKDDVPAVAFHSAEVLERKGDGASYLRAAKLYEKIAWTYGVKKRDKQYALRSYSAAGLAYKKQNKLKNKTRVKKLFDGVLKTWADLNATPEEAAKVAPSTKAYAAHAALELAEYTYDYYMGLKIDALDKNGRFNVKILKETLVSKAEALQRSEKRFDKVLAFKDPGMSAAAAFREGQLLYEFADNLFNAPVPPELNEDQTDEYRYQLEQVAAPVQEKALKAFTAGLKQALQKGVYNEWSQRSAKFAAKVNPDEFPISDFNAKPDKTKDTLQSTSFIRAVRRGDTVVDFTKKVRKKAAKDAEAFDKEASK